MRNEHASKLIDALGGTAEVARLCRVQMPSVSGWRINGIPAARMMFLQAVKPEAMSGIDAHKATYRIAAKGAGAHG